MDNERFAPRPHPGVMISSTFADLKQHRAALTRALENQGLYAEAMERDSALPAGTVIDSSLRMVRQAAAYVGVISHKYGTIPDSADANPDRFSLTELEFREARRLGRPILIFIMGDDHDIKLADVERDPEKVAKLDAFREEVKRAEAESRLQRVYYEFNSLHEFELAATRSVAELRRLLDVQRGSVLVAHPPDSAAGIPSPPALYAEPRYIGSHAFVGRAAELETLYDWAGPAEPHPVLLFEAIGGTGKSMLTWEWTVNHASSARAGLAGTFWYSFYEKGAVMTDFCQRALAYMTGQPMDVLRKKKQRELTSQLMLQLQARPWLLVLDGLERILVAYHRYDAAQVADEKAGRSDQIGHRDPAAAIRPEDDDLLRGLAVASPSKILITSRLVPRALLNPAGQPVPGVQWERLAGLRPADAEALLRACGVRGDSQLIQDYLQRHCDCHPLLTGIVAGLVQDYLPDRGHFDAWAADASYGGHLNLAELDLVQKRNHILKAALAALPDKARQLLSTLALLSEAADYDLLSKLNPHLPPRLGAVADLQQPDDSQEGLPYTTEEYQAAAPELARTVHDLERRGLLQYDRQSDRYDLHPVVRGYAAGILTAEDRDSLGQRVVDYFSVRAQDPYEQAETLDDVRNGLQLVRTLLQMGRISAAFDAYYEGLATALSVRLEAAAEVLALLRPFFGHDWTSPSTDLDDESFSWLATDAADALQELGQLKQSLAVHEAALKVDLRLKDWHYLCVDLSHMTEVFAEQNDLARRERFIQLELEVSELIEDDRDMFTARYDCFRQRAETGRWADAESIWRAHLKEYRADDAYNEAEEAYVRFLFWRGHLTEDLLAHAEQSARSERARRSVRSLYALRGEWRLERGEWVLATDSLREAIRMTREAGLYDARLEIWLALAQFRLGQLAAPREEAIRLSSAPGRAQPALAELWHALGDAERAAGHAQAAYRWAWADGEPYVHAYELGRARALLTQLGAAIPELPAYDPVEDPPLAFEGQVKTVIENLRAEREAGSIAGAHEP
jgi:hypothetical protein